MDLSFSSMHSGFARVVPLLRAGALLAGVLLPGAVSAAEYRVGEQEVHISADEVIDDDLVVQAERIVIEGLVNGDLVAAGQQVTVRGRVKGDLIAAARDLSIDGRVGDDLRVAAYALELGPNARVADDAFSAAFSTDGESGSRIAGSWHLLGYQARLAGRIGENLLGGTKALELAGKVKGDVRVAVDPDSDRPDLVFSLVPTSLDLPRLDPGLVIRENAVIGGNLDYQSSEEAQIESGADVRGEVGFSHREVGEGAREDSRGGIRWSLHLRRLVSLLAVALLLVWLAPSVLPGLWARVEQAPLRSLGWGAGVSLAVAVAAAVVAALTAVAAGLVGALTLGGLAPPLIATGVLLELAILTPFLSVAVYLPPVLAAWGVGHWILRRWRPEWLPGPWRSLGVGALAYVLVVAFPGLGTAIALAIALLGVGALTLQIVDGGGASPPSEAPSATASSP